MQIHRMRIDRQVALNLGELLARITRLRKISRNLRSLFLREQLHGKQRQIFRCNTPLFAHAVNAFLSEVSALRIRVFTVPSGSPVISAISECVSPSKNAISSVLRCSIGSSRITPRAFSIRLFRSASSARLQFEASAISSTCSLGRFLRNASIDRFLATTVSHPPRLPRVAMKPFGLRHICIKTSCNTSSADAGSRSTLNATEYTIFEERS